MLEFFRQGGLAAANRAEQVKDLFLLFQALGRMPEVGNDLVDAFLHAMEVFEGRIAPDYFVRKDP
ncbi:hypothetical protein D3C80_1408290 [compost metagenome]